MIVQIIQYLTKNNMTEKIEKIKREVIRLTFEKIPRLDLVIKAIKEESCLLDGQIHDERSFLCWPQIIGSPVGEKSTQKYFNIYNNENSDLMALELLNDDVKGFDSNPHIGKYRYTYCLEEVPNEEILSIAEKIQAKRELNQK